MLATRRKGLLLWVKPRCTLCQRMKEHWLPFLCLLAAALGFYHIHQWLTEKGQHEEEVFPFLFVSGWCQLLSAPTGHLHTVPVTQGRSEPSWHLFNLCTSGRDNQSKFMSGSVPWAPHGLVGWGCSSCTSRASHRSILSSHHQSPLLTGAWVLKTRAPGEPRVLLWHHIYLGVSWPREPRSCLVQRTPK